MKNTFWTILTVAACSAMTASALDADFAQVTMKAGKPGQANKIVSTVDSKPNTLSFSDSKSKGGRNWQRVSLPVKVEGRARKAKGDNDNPIPDYVDGLTITAHVLFKTADKDGKDKFARVSKTLTYHEIALNKAKDGGECEMSVDLFLSPRNAMKISTAGPRAKSTDVRVIAAAIEATFNGSPCMNKEESPDARFDRTDLPKQWWKSEKVNSCGAVLYAINETPYAAVLPATEAWVTTDAASAATTTTTTTTTGTDDATSTMGADDTTGTTPAADTTPAGDDSAAAEEDTDRRGKNKRGKTSRKNKRTRN